MVSAMEIWTIIQTYIVQELWPRILNILRAPYENTSMLWMLIPILLTLVFMEFYFGRYKEEELGWNTAFGNALVLLFVAIDLFRRLYEPSGKTLEEFIAIGDIKIIISLVVLGLSLLLMLIDFFHILPKKIAYVVSSPGYINMIAALGIIIVYSTGIPLDWTTLFAAFIVFVLVNLFGYILYFIVPSYKPPLQRILTVDDIESLQKKSKKESK